MGERRPKWLWKESTTDRLRRIIDFYRTELSEADPMRCELLDMRMADMGQGWILGGPIDMDRMMTAPQIAYEHGIAQHNVRDWARRHPDQIPTIKHGHRVVFRLGDVLTFQAKNSHKT